MSKPPIVTQMSPFTMEDWRRGPRKVILSLLRSELPFTASFEDNYRIVYNAVLYGHGDEIYEDIKGTFRAYLDDSSIGLKANDESISDEEFARYFLGEWRSYERAAKMTSDMCKYLDMIYCRDNRLPKIREATANLFISRIVFLEDHAVDDRLKRRLLRREKGSEGDEDAQEMGELAAVLESLRKWDVSGRIEAAFGKL